jgi:hypothetical protein
MDRVRVGHRRDIKRRQNVGQRHKPLSQQRIDLMVFADLLPTGLSGGNRRPPRSGLSEISSLFWLGQSLPLLAPR